MELIASVFQSVLALFRVLKLVVDGCPLSFALFSGEPVQSVVDSARELSAYQGATYSGLPVEGMKDQTLYHRELDAALELGENLAKRLGTRDKRYVILKSAILTLTRLRVDSMQRQAGLQRPPPYGIVLHGEPGIGKSHVLTHLANIWSDVKNRPRNDQYMYPRNIKDEYWEGYQPLSQPYVHYSEIARDAPDLAKRQGDEIMTELTSLIDTLPFPVPMAFDLKGKVFASPELVLCDTNNVELNLKGTVFAPSAYRRRFLYIQPVVKPEFRVAGSVRLDSAKSIGDQSWWMDRWLFNVVRKDPVDNVTSINRTILSGVDIYELERFLKADFTRHIEETQAVLRRAEEDSRPQNITTESYTFPSRFKQGISDVYILNLRERFVDPICSVGLSAFALSGAFMTLLALQAVTFFLPVAAKPQYKYMISSLFCSSIAAYYLAWPVIFLLCSASFAIAGAAYMVPGFAAYATQRLVGSLRARYIVRVKGLMSKAAYHMGLPSNFDPLSTDWLAENKAFLSFLGITVACIFGWMCMRRTTTTTRSESNYDDVKASPDVLRDLEETYHCGKSFKTIPLKTQELWNPRVVLERSKFTGSPDDLMGAISRNIRRVRIQGSHRIGTYVLGICQNYALVNKHALLGHSVPVILSVSCSGTLSPLSDEQFKDTPCQGRWIDVSEDVALVSLVGIRFTDIRKHLTSALTFPPICKGMLGPHHVQATFLNDPITMVDKHAGALHLTRQWSYSLPAHTAGICGLPLVVQRDQGSAIVGIHSAGTEAHPRCYAAPIIRESVQGALDALASQFQGMPILSGGIFTESVLVDPHPKSPFRYERLPGIEYFGSLPGNAHMNNKSKIETTPYFLEAKRFFRDVLRHEQRVAFGRPLMKAHGSGLDYVSPYNNGLRKMGVVKPSLDQGMLDKIVGQIVDRIVEALKLRGVPSLSPLDTDTAINGSELDPFIRRMNVNTSSGFGWRAQKSDLLPIASETPGRVTRVPTPELEEAVIRYISSVDSDNFPPTIYSASLKDEPRALDKIQSGNTRLFFVSPIESIIVSRMFLAPFYSLMMQHGDVFCSAVGINSHTVGDELHSRLTSFSPHIMEGDYSSYDQSMPYEIGLAACSVVYKVLERMGYPDNALTVVQRILSESLHPWVELNRDIFEVPGMQPSGKYATAEDNSLRGLILLMYGWASALPTLSDKFFEYCCPLVYGDDVLVSVKPSVVHRFNNIQYSRICADLFKMKYTPANKGDAHVPFGSIEDVSFLKRRFVFRADLRHWTMQLDKDSILRSLMLYIPSGVVPKRDQMLDTLSSALWELFFHLNSDEYGTVRTEFIKWKQVHLDFPVGMLDNRLPTYEEILDSLGW